MGHLIAGGCGSAESIGVSTAPSPSPKTPAPRCVQAVCTCILVGTILRGLRSQECLPGQ